MSNTKNKSCYASSLPSIALALLFGVCVLQIQPALQFSGAVSEQSLVQQGPIWTHLEIVMLLPIFMWLFYLLPKRRSWLAFFIGYCWALLFAQLYLQHQLPEAQVGNDILLEGRVTGLPENNAKSIRFNFQVSHIISVTKAGKQLKTQLPPNRLRLSWYYHRGNIHSGERWRLQVRLKPAHGMQNSGGFDYEKWLYQQGIHATGYVRKNKQNRLLEPATAGLGPLREKLLQILSNLPDSRYQGLLQALTIGHKSAISSEQWQVLRQTGTSHLMAISGLHIGLVAGLVFLLVRRFVPVFLCKYSSAPQIAALVSLIFAGFYALLAGFSVPTQRAFIMLLVIMSAVFIKRPALSINSLSLALLAVLIIDPACVLSAGFWLSFLAVLIIALVSAGRIKVSQLKRRAWLQGVRVQWLIALAMLPLSVLLFQQGSFISPLANMLVIPLVGMLIVPLALLASLSAVFSTELSLWLFTQTSELFSYIWILLSSLSQLPMASWQRSSIPLLHSVLALLGVVLLLMPRGFPLRYSGLILLLPMLLYRYPRPEQGAFWVSVLDVGQGLSVLVQTREKSLLYDAGAKLGKKFDIGQRVVVPYLNYIGLQKLDVLMISHADNDHAGGADAVLGSLQVQQLLAEAEALKPRRRVGSIDEICRAGQNWQWNEVNFEVLHPPQYFKKSNNRSCVLKIWNAHYSVLLSGDIEQKAELSLLKLESAKLSSDVLLVPHHGSNTSSSQHWLEQVNPQLAIVSAAYKNRFGHPTAKVLSRYQNLPSRVLNTASSGMIQLKFPVKSAMKITEPQQQRKDNMHYWNHRF